MAYRKSYRKGRGKVRKYNSGKRLKKGRRKFSNSKKYYVSRGGIRL